jgi:hypothetical protein
MLAQLVCVLVLTQAADPAKPRCTLPEGDGETMLQLAQAMGSPERVWSPLFSEFERPVARHDRGHGWRTLIWDWDKWIGGWIPPARSAPCHGAWLDQLARSEFEAPLALMQASWILERAGRIEDARRLLEAERRARPRNSGLMGLQLGTIQLAAFEKRQGRWKESLAQLDGPLDGRPGCFPDPEYSARYRRIESSADCTWGLQVSE